MLADGVQCLLPPPAPHGLCQDAEGERQQHPRPVHFVQHDVAHHLEVEVTIHPVKYGTAQSERHHDFQQVAAKGLAFHKCKVT